MTLESSKNLGGIGAIISFIGSIGFLFYQYLIGLLVVGVILIFVALRGYGNYFKETGIVANAIYGLVTSIVGIAVTGIVGIFIVFDTNIVKNFLLDLWPTWNQSWSTLPSIASTTPNTTNLPNAGLVNFFGAVFALIVVISAFAIVSAFFVRRSLKIVAVKTLNKWFATSGLVLLIGAFLMLAFLLPGLLVIWVAEIILAFAFFAKTAEQPQQMQTNTAPPPTSTPVLV
jgi:uncharacterized membrane protein